MSVANEESDDDGWKIQTGFEEQETFDFRIMMEVLISWLWKRNVWRYASGRFYGFLCYDELLV
jgi:hypothetical protein